jgi:hypothetical protein
MLSNCSIWRSSSIGVSVCLPFCLSFFLRFLLSFCGIFNNVQTSKSYVQKLSLGRKNLLFYFFTILCLHGCNLTKSIFHLLFPNLVYFALFSFSHLFLSELLLWFAWKFYQSLFEKLSTIFKNFIIWAFRLWFERVLAFSTNLPFRPLLLFFFVNWHKTSFSELFWTQVRTVKNIPTLTT